MYLSVVCVLCQFSFIRVLAWDFVLNWSRNSHERLSGIAKSTAIGRLHDGTIKKS